MYLNFRFLLLSGLLILSGFRIKDNSQDNKIGSEVTDFKLKNTDHSMVSLSDVKQAKGYIIIFTCNHCPFAKLYSKRLNNLNKKYKPLGVPLIAINSLDSILYKEESFELMQEKAKKDHFNFPYLQDATQSVGKDFNAKHTPQSYVIWKIDNKWIIKYAGAIDDDGEHPQKATSYISNAVDDLLANRIVALPVTATFGCKIFYRKQ